MTVALQNWIDRTGHRFGHLTALSFLGTRKNVGAWACICDCGNACIKNTSALTALKPSQYCGQGCYFISAAKSREHKTHGMSTKSAEYRSWQVLKDRCLNPSSKRFTSWGGRGITVCERWKDDFEAFYADMGPKPSARHSIDRIDNDGNYEPSNCRWATPKEQAHNRATNIWVTVDDSLVTLAEAAARLGVTRTTATRWQRMGKLR